MYVPGSTGLDKFKGLAPLPVATVLPLVSSNLTVALVSFEYVRVEVNTPWLPTLIEYEADGFLGFSLPEYVTVVVAAKDRSKRYMPIAANTATKTMNLGLANFLMASCVLRDKAFILVFSDASILLLLCYV